MRTSRTRVLATLTAAGLLIAGCTADDPGAAGGNGGSGGSNGTTVTGGTPFDGTYRATIERTTDGVPHITGANVESALFGQGYASGEDYTCTLADQLLKVQGRRAEVLGAGDQDANLNSDFAWRQIGIDALARKDYAGQPDDVKAQMVAFSAGWNKHLADTGAASVNGWCAGADWLKPIAPEDLYAYARSIALNASSSQVARYLGKAQPPASTEAATGTAEQAAGGGSPTAGDAPLASNGWAIGKERTEGGGGMLVANPHFPWEGELRFWEVHLTVPGELNIYGSQLQGMPGVGIGFTSEFAWTHTVSNGNRFTAYTLDLVPGKPTSYQYDDAEREMTSRVETVKVKGDDGTVTEQQRTLWFSHYGPILDFPGVGWSAAMTVTYRDANLDNDELIPQYLAMDTAKSFEEFQQAHETHQGIPLFNTIAVSKDGRAWYADTSATPNLSKEALAAYDAATKTPGIAQVAGQSGAILLDGSDSLYEWVDEPGSRDPGLVPYTRMPQTERADYVFNANDSYWVNHADTFLEGDYSLLHGRADTARSARTRENATVLSDLTPDGPSGDDGKFDLTELRDAALLNRGYLSRALKDDVVERCATATVVDVPQLDATDGTVALPAEAVDVTAACDALGSWDGLYNVDSRGAHVWREMMIRFEPADMSNAGALWANAFDPAEPVATPSGLAAAPTTGADPVLVALARAVQVITKAGFAPDTPLGEIQYTDRSGERIPLHGGFGSDGTPNVLGYSASFSSSEPISRRGPTFAPRSNLTETGYPVNYGSSFIMTVEFTADGPQAFAFLTYGETEDRTAPEFSSQTKRFSAKDWRQVLFTDAAINADPAHTEKSVSS